MKKITYKIISKNKFKDLKKENLSIFYMQTSAGLLKCISHKNYITSAEFSNEEINQENITFINNFKSLNLIISGTEFQIKIWLEILKIPLGQTKTYQEIAISINKPKAHRAVANALANNKIAYFIPCHRIIQKNGNLSGYKWGIDKKLALLKSESLFN